MHNAGKGSPGGEVALGGQLLKATCRTDLAVEPGKNAWITLEPASSRLLHD